LDTTTDVDSALMVIQTDKGAVFGAYLSDSWRSTERQFPAPTKTYWGDNRTFLFQFAPFKK
jgi:hypothetical protein